MSGGASEACGVRVLLLIAGSKNQHHYRHVSCQQYIQLSPSDQGRGWPHHRVRRAVYGCRGRRQTIQYLRGTYRMEDARASWALAKEDLLLSSLEPSEPKTCRQGMGRGVRRDAKSAAASSTNQGQHRRTGATPGTSRHRCARAHNGSMLS